MDKGDSLFDFFGDTGFVLIISFETASIRKSGRIKYAHHNVVSTCEFVQPGKVRLTLIYISASFIALVVKRLVVLGIFAAQDVCEQGQEGCLPFPGLAYSRRRN